MPVRDYIIQLGEGVTEFTGDGTILPQDVTGAREPVPPVPAKPPYVANGQRVVYEDVINQQIPRVTPSGMLINSTLSINGNTIEGIGKAHIKDTDATAVGSIVLQNKDKTLEIREGDDPIDENPPFALIHPSCIPSTFATDTEVSTAIGDHAALTTGIHGLGTMSQQNASAVAITGGTITSVTITNVTINTSTIDAASLPVHDNYYHTPIAGDQTNTTGTSTHPFGDVAANAAVGQTFTAGLNQQIVHCSIRIGKVGTPTDALKVHLYDATAAQPTTSRNVMSALVQARDISDTEDWVDFYFPNQYGTGTKIDSGGIYALVIERTGALDATNYYFIGYADGVDAYTSGNLRFYDSSTSTWGAGSPVLTPNSDLKFQTYYGYGGRIFFVLDQLDPMNGILPVENLGTGTLGTNTVLTGNTTGPGAWSSSITLTDISVTNLTIGGVTITATGTELNFTDGVTSAIQTQLDGKVPYTGATANVDLGSYNITSRTYRISNASNSNIITLIPDTSITANRSVAFGDYDGTVLLNQQVILASESASTNPYTISLNVTQVYGSYAGTATVYLPSGCPQNKVYSISAQSGCTMILTPPSGQTIDGGLSSIWLYPLDSVIISLRGTDWQIISDNDNIIGIADGGTGATTAADARTNLGVAIGVDVQAYNANTTILGNTTTGTGSIVLATSPTLVTPNLGTPSAGTLTNCTGLPISTGVSGLGTGVATFLSTPTSANLAAAVTDETGTGALVLATSPTLNSPTIGTPTFTGNISQTTGTTFTNTATLNSSTNVITDYIADGVYYKSAIVSKPGTIGNALSLDGTETEYIYHPYISAYLIQTTISIAAWIYPDTVAGEEIILARGEDSSTYPNTVSYAFSRNTTNLDFLYRGSNGVWQRGRSTGITITTGEWQHVAVTFTYGTGSSLTFYRNGSAGSGVTWVSGNGNTGVITETARRINIGATHTEGLPVVASWTGDLDQVLLYNVALSASDIASIYNGGAGTSNVPSTGLVLHDPLNETSGSVIDDVSSNNNDGTGVGLEDTDWVTGKVPTTDADVTRYIFRYIDGVAGNEAGILQIGDVTNYDATIKLLGRNVIIGNEVALATTATIGFLYIPAMDGAPTGTPTDYTGKSAMVHDRTNNRIYFYDHASDVWQYAALT